MRVLIAVLLMIGGGLAALALIWMFYTTSDPKSSSAISVVTDEGTEEHKENMEILKDSETIPIELNYLYRCSSRILMDELLTDKN